MAAAASPQPAPSVALYYGQASVPAEFRVFDWVVLEPDHHPQPREALRTPSLPLAYVAVGESHPSRSWSREISAEWILGKNAIWGSHVMDMSHPRWREFLIDKVFRPQWDRGYRGFFLDTLDSYRLVPGKAEAAQQRGLVMLVREVKRHWPQAKLIVNRGFEVLPELRGLVDLVAAESLYRAWDEETKRFREVPDVDRQWLTAQLAAARALGMPCLSIDYVPPHERDLARRTARQISDGGCLPYVSDPELRTVGIGSVEAVPRRVLVLYNGAESTHLRISNVKRYLQMPIEYLGYIVDYADILQPLPDHVQPDRYAGIVGWFTGGMPKSAAERLNGWWVQQIDRGLRYALLGHLPTPLSNDLSDRMGLVAIRTAPAGTTMATTSALIGYEMAPPLHSPEIVVSLAPGVAPLIHEKGVPAGGSVAAALTAQGGFVLDPFVVQDLPGVDQVRWVVDPFNFVQAALRLPAIPVPDTTTENGRRLLTVHIDGDGFISRAERTGAPLAGRVLLDDVLRPLRLPTAMSFIEAEVAPHGLYAAMAGEAQAAAREILRLPHVEAATHTWSHPFVWSQTKRDTRQVNAATGSLYLNIPGYSFNLEREIVGSARFITERLSPPNKPVRLLQWSGDTSPDPEAIAMANSAGLLNINGGDTIITRDSPSVSSIGAQGLWLGGHLQVHAPIANENIYTNLWSGPFDGYRRVVETFEMTDRPRRIKPVGIYYHTYSASKPASLKALNEVYAWAMARPLHPVYTTEFVRKVHDFYDGALASRDGRWLWRGNGALRTLRVPAKLGAVDLLRSDAVVGWRGGMDGQYVHLADQQAWLAIGPSTDVDTPRLIDANGRVVAMQRTAAGMQIELKAHVPLEWSVPDTCTSRQSGRAMQVAARGAGQHSYKVSHDRATFEIVCAR